MFRIVRDPSSGSIELYLTEIRSGSLMFIMCLVSVWQHNFEPVVCVHGTMGWELVLRPSYRTHTPLVQKLRCQTPINLYHMTHHLWCVHLNSHGMKAPTRVRCRHLNA